MLQVAWNKYFIHFLQDVFLYENSLIGHGGILFLQRISKSAQE